MVACQLAAWMERTRETPRRAPIANARQQEPIANYLLVTDRWQMPIGTASATSLENAHKKGTRVARAFFAKVPMAV
jgi:hypothetical protein